jgi:hypothetical protein
MKDTEVIPTGWRSGFSAGMSTTFELDGSFYAAPGVSDYARRSLTVKEARFLVTSGKAIRTEATKI